MLRLFSFYFVRCEISQVTQTKDGARMSQFNGVFNNKIIGMNSFINDTIPPHKCHHERKYFRYMEEHQKDNALRIDGVPPLPSDEMWIFFQTLCRSMRILYRDKDIVSIWQSTNHSRNKILTYPPIYVKFKKKTIKDKYLGLVKGYFYKHKGQRGCTVSHGNKTFFNICIGEYYPTDLAKLLKKASNIARQYGFACYINQSKVYIRRNLTDVFSITNEDHLNLLRKNKSARVVEENDDARMDRVQFDVINPMMYRQINENKLKAKA
uniref:Uncharacterized protein n=1 Tax=Cacopsylla melanoneura TaxID=428564 RepID=A0A8D8PYQ8_9HEMI